MKRYIAMAALSLMTTIAAAGCLTDDGTVAIQGVTQDTHAYLASKNQDQRLITEAEQTKLSAHYLKQYYFPWELGSRSTVINAAKHDILSEAKGFVAYPGWAIDKQKHEKSWVKEIVESMRMDQYPTVHQRAITLKATYVRALPTSIASYLDISKPGDGFPFDRYQYSLIPGNLPVLVVHQSHDKRWSFVITHIASGWVKSDNIANVDHAFITQWKKQHYVTLKKYSTKLTSENKKSLLVQLGMILPLAGETKHDFQVLMATADEDRQAVINTVNLSKDVASLWPMKATPKNIADVSNELMGEPYGWGGLFFHRDCSAAMMDIFSGFGIWLPRNSHQQAYTGHFVSLKNLDESEKIKTIQTNAKPWLTLVDLDGHVTLYLGEKNGKQYVLQNKWGIHTTTKKQPDGRAILGKTFISTIDLGKGYSNVPRNDLDRAYGITVLGGG